MCKTSDPPHKTGVVVCKSTVHVGQSQRSAQTLKNNYY
jgi:UDP-glucose 6-dehydrogenase